MTYKFLADFDGTDISESDVEIELVGITYEFRQYEYQRDLYIRYTVQLENKTMLQELVVRNDILSTLNINNRDNIEECVLDYLKTKSEFSNIRDVA